jgi:hypothetical protein
VDRLSQDILCRIARCALNKTTKDTKPIIALTQVCRHWRESIVSTPDIWALISSGNNSLAALSLERSRTALLKIYLNLRVENREFIDLLLPRILDIGSLRIQGFSSPQELIMLLPDFPLSTPNLRSLGLRGKHVPNSERNQSIDPFEPFGDSLRHLSIHHFHLCPSLLGLTSLTELEILDYRLNTPIDTLLNFLKENRSLETAILGVGFAKRSLRRSKLDAPIENQLRHLSIRCAYSVDGKALISGIALQRGAHLDILHTGVDHTLSGVLSGVSLEHLANITSPTFVECQSDCRSLRLLGPNGDFFFKSSQGPEGPFSELSQLPLSFASVREFRLVHRGPKKASSPLEPLMFHPPSLPSIEAFAVNCETNVSYLLFELFSNPFSCPSLKTLAFLDCDISEDFVEELGRFVSNRMATGAARLDRVVIVHSKGKLPSAVSVAALGLLVPVVDVRTAKELPKDLT